MHYPLAYACVGVLVISWVSMSELLQSLQISWAKPFFILYCVHGPGYSSLLLPWCALRARRLARAPQTVVLPLPYPRLARNAAALAMLSALSGYAWYLSLSHTWAAANSAIYQSSAAIVFMLSVLFLREPVSPLKLGATAIAIGGVCLVSFAGADHSDGGGAVQPTSGGYLWLLLSVCTYASYEVAFAWMMGGHRHREVVEAPLLAAAAAGEVVETPLLAAAAAGGERVDAPRAAEGGNESWALYVRAEQAAFTIGSIGVWSLLLLLPVLPLLSATGVEPFEWPPAAKMHLLLLSVALDVCFNTALLLGIVASSPLVMSLGSMLVVPATVAADAIVHGALLSAPEGIGVVVICAGFVLLQLRPKGWWGRALARGGGVS